MRPAGQVLWFGQASLEPITPFDHARSDRTDAADLATLVRLVAAGLLHPEIGSVDAWDQAGRVVDDIRQRRLRGNAVLRVAA